MTADELLVTAMSLNSSQDESHGTYASNDLTQTTLATGSQSINRNIIDVDLDRSIVNVDHDEDFGQTKVPSFYKSASQKRTDLMSSSSSYSYVDPNLSTSLDPFSGLTADQVEILSQFQDITGTDVDTAKHLLEVLYALL